MKNLLVCDKIKIVISSIKMYQKMIQETTDKKLYENLSKNLEKELNNLKKLQELYPEYFI